MRIEDINKIHCIGIGGIGVSAIARYFIEKGKKVSGSDIMNSKIIKQLIDRGVDVHIGIHTTDNVPKDADVVIYSPAIQRNNPEYVEAVSRVTQVYSYPEMVAKLMKGFTSIVITGTHGKSTTTAMVGKIFQDSGMKPTVIVGSLVDSFDGNILVGNGKHFIVEGDEFGASFLHYYPHILVITSIEADHLDFYDNVRSIIQAFNTLAIRVPEDGFIIAKKDDRNISEALKGVSAKIVYYGKGSKNDHLDVKLHIPGRHNELNALAAQVVSEKAGINQESIWKSLKDFKPIWRRFECKGEVNGILVIDDYAHHPTEIKATLKAAKEKYPSRRLWCVFQPHQRNRTRMLFKDFIGSFVDADKLILTEAFFVEGREENESITTKQLYEEIKKKRSAQYIDRVDDITENIIPQLQDGDVVITMGAGNITHVSDQILHRLKKI
ncbi:UDP-N-acetylmuramate--L-alanine ligase [Patescibacteria group bacterium]